MNRVSCEEEIWSESYRIITANGSDFFPGNFGSVSKESDYFVNLSAVGLFSARQLVPCKIHFPVTRLSLFSC